MKLGTSLQYSGDVQDVIGRAVAMERAGADVIWAAEAYGFDSVSLLGYLAARTERAELGSSILNIYSRTPALLAQTAAGLDALSGGRTILGLGASGPQVVEGWHGLPYERPLARTRDVVEICRRIWRREAVDYTGATVSTPLPPARGTGLGKPLKMINHPVRDRVPVYLAALGEKNVELTAEIADGWLPLFFVPEQAKTTFGAALAAGTARRAPELGGLQIAAGGILAISEDRAALRDLGRPGAALYIGGMGARGRNFYNDLVCRYGYEAEAARIQELYLSGRKKEAEAAVPDELIDLTNLMGPASFVRERIDAHREAGVTVLNVSPVGRDPAALLAKVREWV